jgi:hypothetical protein
MTIAPDHSLPVSLEAPHATRLPPTATASTFSSASSITAAILRCLYTRERVRERERVNGRNSLFFTQTTTFFLALKSWKKKQKWEKAQVINSKRAPSLLLVRYCATNDGHAVVVVVASTSVHPPPARGVPVPGRAARLARALAPRHPASPQRERRGAPHRMEGRDALGRGLAAAGHHGRVWDYLDHTGCHQLVVLTIRPTRVVTPGGCPVGYMDHHTECFYCK